MSAVHILFAKDARPELVLESPSPYTIEPNDTVHMVRQKIYFALIEQGRLAADADFNSLYLCTFSNRNIHIPDIYTELVHAYTEHDVPFKVSLTQLSNILRFRGDFLKKIERMSDYPNSGEFAHFMEASIPPNSDPKRVWTPIGLFLPGEMPYLYSGLPENWSPEWLQTYQRNHNWFLTNVRTPEQHLIREYMPSIGKKTQAIYVFFRPADALNATALVTNHWPTLHMNTPPADTIPRIRQTTDVLRQLQTWSTQLEADKTMDKTGYMRFSVLLWTFQMPKYFSLNMIFQNIHATEKIPAIKCTHIDKFIRFYSTMHDANANAIPNLAPAHIQDWSAQYTDPNRLYLYVRPDPDIHIGTSVANYYYTVIISPDGKIEAHLPQYVTGMSTYPVTNVDIWQNAIQTDVYPALTPILEYIQTVGLIPSMPSTLTIYNIHYKEEYEKFKPVRNIQTVNSFLGTYLAPVFQTSYVSAPSSNKNAVAILMKRVAHYDPLFALNRTYKQYKLQNKRAGNARDFITMLRNNFDKITQADIDTQSSYRPKDHATDGMRIVLLFSSTTHIHVIYHSVSSPDELALASTYVAAILYLLELPEDLFQRIYKEKQIHNPDKSSLRPPIEHAGGELTRIQNEESTDDDEESKNMVSNKEESADAESDEEENDEAESDEEEFESDEEEFESDDEDEEIDNANTNADKISDVPNQTTRIPEQSDDDSFDPFNQSSSDSDTDMSEGEVEGGGKKVSAGSFVGRGHTTTISLKGKQSFLNERREHYDPVLYANEGIKQNNYSQKCQTNIKVQPIMLPKHEFEQQDPSTYDEFIRYGTNPENEFYYICPRFWCFRKNRAMTLDQVNRGECADKGRPDTILPPDATSTVAEDGDVYEFTSRMHLDANGEYITHTPIFQKMMTKTGEYKGVPCCGQTKYHNWDIFYANRPDEYYEHPDEFRAYLANRKKGDSTDAYIVQPDKPATERRMGNITPNMEALFRHFNNIYVTDKPLGTQRPYIIRYGVEASANASIFAAMADLYAHVHNISPVPRISEFTARLAEHIQLDQFVRYNHGRLVSIFAEAKVRPDLVWTEAETQSRYVRKSTPNMKPYLPFVIQAYRNFIAYLTTPANERNSPVSPEFLVDIFCMPNANIIPSGVNFIIIEEKASETAENPSEPQLHMYCPKYSSYPLYTPSKPSWIVIKRKHVYEPIYVFQKQSKSSSLTRLHTTDSTSPLASFLENVNRSQHTTLACKPDTTGQEFRHNQEIDTLFEAIRTEKQELRPTAILYNTHGLITGVQVIDRSNTPRFFYCRPSRPRHEIRLPSLPATQIPTDTYTQTFSFLQKWAATSLFLCAPRYAVVRVNENTTDVSYTVIGILTETYQYYPISPPISYSDIPSESSLPKWISYVQNPLTASESVLMPTSPNDITHLRSLQTETYFYQLFQKRMRSKLSETQSFRTKQQITTILANPNRSIADKRNEIRDVLVQIGSELFVFQEINKTIWADLDLESDTISRALCTDTGHWIMPRRNLGNPQFTNNQVSYYMRLADELVRNIRIRNYILKTDKYVFMYRSGVQLRPNEILINISDLKQYIKPYMAYNVDGIQFIPA